MNLRNAYFKVDWPSSQRLMHRKGFRKCILGDIDSSVYFVPINLYESMMGYHPQDTVYFLYTWPESQQWMSPSKIKHCIPTLDIKNHPKTGTSAYFVPWHLILQKERYALIDMKDWNKYPDHVAVGVNGFDNVDYAVPADIYKQITGKRPSKVYRIVFETSYSNNPLVDKNQYIRIPNICLYNFPKQPYLVAQSKFKNKNGILQ